MRTIPTDLLRALVTVVDLGGYTRAGERLGRTQPAVSLQIRRLQDLLGVALLERDGGTPRLTEAGEICLGYARRILALHDDMLHRLVAHGAGARIRIGFPTDFADHFLPHVLTGLEEGHDLPGHVEIVSDLSVNLLRDVRAGSLDIALAMTPSHLPDGAMASWREAVMWVGAGRRRHAGRLPRGLPVSPHDAGASAAGRPDVRRGLYDRQPQRPGCGPDGRCP